MSSKSDQKSLGITIHIKTGDLKRAGTDNDVSINELGQFHLKRTDTIVFLLPLSYILTQFVLHKNIE